MTYRLLAAIALAGALSACNVTVSGFGSSGKSGAKADADTTASADAAIADVPSDTTTPVVDTTTPDAFTPLDSGQPLDTPPPVDIPAPECTETNAEFKCNDNLPCTADACEAGACVHAPIAGCCVTDEECDDGIGCTVDECTSVGHKCLNTPEDSLCCTSADACDDGDPCTQDACAANHCVAPHTAGPTCGCSSPLQCDDGNPCTADDCNGGTCAYASTGAPGCCVTGADCDDGDPETTDACEQGTCASHPAACAADADCATTDPCMAASCQGGVCVLTAADPLCCTTDGDCDDGAAVTTDRCVASRCVHGLGEPEPCGQDGSCAAPGPCATAECVADAGLCTVTPTQAPGCCTTASDCLAGPCQEATCEALQCKSAPGPKKTLWEDTFPTGTLDGWDVESDGTAAKWQIGGEVVISAPHSLYYGRLPEQDYDVGHTQGTARSPEQAAPAPGQELWVSFWVNPLVEVIFSEDKVWVTLESGGKETTIWSKSDLKDVPIPGWKHVEKEVSTLVSGPFRIALHFDSVDGKMNDYKGVFVDDVRVQAPCE